jgi:hypothetical protein
MTDRREDIAKAFEQLEQANAPEPEKIAPEPAPAPAPEPVAAEPTPAPEPEPAPAPAPEPEPAAAEPAPVPAAEPTTAEAAPNNVQPDEPAQTHNFDRPPQSWKAKPAAHWAKLDPEVRSEIVRREREIQRGLEEASSARQFANTFGATIQPYIPRIRAAGGDPLAVVQSLLQADHVLASGQPQQKAALLAQFVKDYNVNIEMLDMALSGQAQPAAAAPAPAPVDIEALVDQRLEQRTMRTAIENMSRDKANFPHFDMVRETMADVVEMYARKSRPITLQEAYNMAVGMTPSLVQEPVRSGIPQRPVTTVQQVAATNAQITGAPAGTRRAQIDPNNRRAVLEAAFDAASGR